MCTKFWNYPCFFGFSRGVSSVCQGLTNCFFFPYVCCTRPVDFLHPWKGAPSLDDCGHWWILLPISRRKIQGRVKNPRVGWVKSMEKGPGNCWERWNKHLKTIIYLLILWLISKWKLHGCGRPDPWMGMGGKNAKIRNTKIKNENNMYFHLANKPKINT